MPDVLATAPATPAARLADLETQLADARREQAEAGRVLSTVTSQLPRDLLPNEGQPGFRDAVLARCRAADARIARLQAAIAQAHADVREALESDSAPLLAELDADLTASRDRLAAAARAMQDALAGLLAAAAGYGRQVDIARARLGRAGFDTATRARLIAEGLGTADRYPTHDDHSHMHILGVAWPILSPAAAIAWTLEQAADAMSGGQALIRLAGSQAALEARTLDALLAEANRDRA